MSCLYDLFISADDVVYEVESIAASMMTNIVGAIPYFGAQVSKSECRISLNLSLKFTHMSTVDRRIMPTMKDVLASGDTSRIVQYPIENRVTKPPVSLQESNVGALSHLRGTLEMGCQYHYTMETQCTVCIPAEDGGIDVYPSSQWMDLVQVAISEALIMPQKLINIVIRRVGGSYGAKGLYSAHIASACAIACHLSRRRVRFVMSIEDNMSMYGKRYACKSDYTVAVETQSGKIKTLTNSFVEDAGCSINESLVQLAAHGFHNCYGKQPDWLVTPNVLTTDAPSNLWCRAPFHTEGIAMIETIMEHIGREIGKDASEVRLANIPSDNPMGKIYAQFLKDVGETYQV